MTVFGQLLIKWKKGSTPLRGYGSKPARSRYCMSSSIMVMHSSFLFIFGVFAAIQSASGFCVRKFLIASKYTDSNLEESCYNGVHYAHLMGSRPWTLLALSNVPQPVCSVVARFAYIFNASEHTLKQAYDFIDQVPWLPCRTNHAIWSCAQLIICAITHQLFLETDRSDFHQPGLLLQIAFS